MSAPGLDRNAWFFPEGGFATSIGITGSQIDVNTGGNSLLQLHAVWNPGPTYPGGFGQTPTAWSLAGGMVMWNAMQMLYGTVEGRIKFTGTGTHPTFWLFDVNTRQTNYQQTPNGTIGPDHNEIDIAEGRPATAGNTTTLRFAVNGPGNGFLSVDDVPGFTDYSTNFHTYRMTWTPLSVTFWVDGVQQYQTTTSIPVNPMYLVMDIECGDVASGAVSQSNFPGSGQVYQCDYVKAWDLAGNLIFYDEFNGSPAFQNNETSSLEYIQGATVIGSVGTSQALAYPINMTSKSWLLALGFAATGSTTMSVTDTLGNLWTQVGTNLLTNGGSSLAVFQCASNVPSSGANTVTLHSSVSAQLNLTIAEYCGQASTPVQGFTTSSNWSGTSASLGPTAPNLKNESMVTLSWLNNNAAVTGADGTIRLNGSSFAVIEDRAIQASPYYATWQSGASDQVAMAVNTGGKPLVYLQSATAIGSVSTSQALAYSSSVTAGSLLICLALIDGAGTTSVTDSLGNTWVQVVPPFSPNNTFAVFICASNKSSGANTVTLHSTVSEQLAMVIGEYTGQTSTNPIDSYLINHYAGVAGTNASIGPLTLTPTDSVIIIGWIGSAPYITGADGNVRLSGLSNGVLVDRSFSQYSSWTNGALGGAGMMLLAATTSTMFPTSASSVVSADGPMIDTLFPVLMARMRIAAAHQKRNGIKEN